MSGRLERCYRLLLRLYPGDYRDKRSEELIDTLMLTSGRFPVREIAALVAGALTARALRARATRVDSIDPRRCDRRPGRPGDMPGKGLAKRSWAWLLIPAFWALAPVCPSQQTGDLSAYGNGGTRRGSKADRNYPGLPHRIQKP
ncbi:hypothetical protein [Nonomuraea sp. NPDC003709]|uniref:hypothetical protein n=1 Tax=Nonomuraea sp. NPDC003709 TaxID=3154450 RepID=UPI0033BD43B7